MTVIYRTEPIRKDPSDQKYHYATVGEIEFFAFPYQNYCAHNGRYWADVSADGFFTDKGSGLIKVYSAGIYQSYPNGKSNPVDKDCYKRFDTLDETFEWAAKRLLELGG